ncbi:efflux transporter periplasmic adaptor subunit [Thiohalocapsa halophila]|uniref:Efflux transporter periplasmic adaptor subunit n=1 Tax=Thiohalocapsa halophila TaxID=69359 RepID=A0ABS1CFF2_9GAMM|nr:efflux RND transporter periplasmic adaptor subunit [Thiohalocapsa halophila]MBK1630619.1 efflux transporter periplasmic adaptor subunit [Thiohalocapsa halophila]
MPILLALLLLSPAAALAAGPDVIVAEARSEPWADRTEALGTLRANESVVITATVTETISDVHFDDGQRVATGDVLVEMTSAEEDALLEEVRARVAEAERQYQRVQSLAERGSASASLLDERRRDLDTARASLVAVESRLKDRVVKAPFAGVVGLRNISLGALVEPGDVITTLDDDRIMKLDFTVPSVFLPSLRPGLAIEARAPALGEQAFVGEISAVDTRVDPVTRSVQVRALLPNPERVLRPGLLMRVELLRNPRQSLTVPEEALLHRGDDHFVLALAEGEDGAAIPERRQVQIGARRPGFVEITGGLAAGERVITHGNDKAKPGEPVTVMAVDDGTRPLAELLAQRPAADAEDRPAAETSE